MNEKKLPACLFGVGLLGHTWCVTKLYDDKESVVAQVSYGKDAAKIFNEMGGHRIFAKTKRTWRAVSVGFAASTKS